MKRSTGNMGFLWDRPCAQKPLLQLKTEEKRYCTIRWRCDHFSGKLKEFSKSSNSVVWKYLLLLFRYNFGDYLEHWLSFDRSGIQLPKIFHVNWFRKGTDGKFLWPGFGENCRVLDWIFQRVENQDCAVESAIGQYGHSSVFSGLGL